MSTQQQPDERNAQQFAQQLAAFFGGPPRREDHVEVKQHVPACPAAPVSRVVRDDPPRRSTAQQFDEQARAFFRRA